MKVFKFFVSLIIIGSILLPFQPVFAAGCYESTCHGKDPNAMGCSGWTVMRLFNENSTSGGLWTELRYSNGSSCYSNWTKVSNYNYNVRHLTARLSTNNPPTYTVAQIEDKHIYSYIWTNMETAQNVWCAKGDQGLPGQPTDLHSAYTCG